LGTVRLVEVGLKPGVTGLPTPCNANRWSSGAELVRRALNPGYAGVEIPKELHQHLGRGRRGSGG